MQWKLNVLNLEFMFEKIGLDQRGDGDLKHVVGVG